MKSFNDFINEKKIPVLGKTTVLPLSGIKPDIADAAIKTGQKDGEKSDDSAAYKSVKIAVKNLKAAQTEIIPEKAIGMAIGMMLGSTLKIGGDLGSIISADNYIMDGHHRWAATYLCDPGASVEGTQIGLDGIPLVSALNIITKGVHGRNGNPGKGNIADFTGKVIGKIVDGYATNGIPGDYPISAEDVKERLGRVPGAKGDWEEGKKLMMKHADMLPKKIMPGAPARIDMPVINPEEVKAAAEMIKKGEVDLTNPFSEETKTKIAEGFLPNEESFVLEGVEVYDVNEGRNDSQIHFDNAVKTLSTKEVEELYGHPESDVDFTKKYIDQSAVAKNRIDKQFKHKNYVVENLNEGKIDALQVLRTMDNKMIIKNDQYQTCTAAEAAKLLGISTKNVNNQVAKIKKDKQALDGMIYANVSESEESGKRKSFIDFVNERKEDSIISESGVNSSLNEDEDLVEAKKGEVDLTNPLSDDTEKAIKECFVTFNPETSNMLVENEEDINENYQVRKGGEIWDNEYIDKNKDIKAFLKKFNDRQYKWSDEEPRLSCSILILDDDKVNVVLGFGQIKSESILSTIENWAKETLDKKHKLDIVADISFDVNKVKLKTFYCNGVKDSLPKEWKALDEKLNENHEPHTNSIISEGVHHATYHYVLITKDFKINHETVSNDLAADAFEENNFRNKDCAFAFSTTDSRWQNLANDAVKQLKAGKDPKEVGYDLYDFLEENLNVDSELSMLNENYIAEGALSLDKDSTRIMGKIAAYMKQYKLSDSDAEKILQNLVIGAKHGALSAYSSAVLDRY